MNESPSEKDMLSDDELTLHLIATGLLRLINQFEAGGSLSYPYPTSLQHGLNRLTVASLKVRTSPPQSIPDLFIWCRKPLSEWPLVLPEGAYGATDTLLDDDVVTDICEHWAYPGSNIQDELNEQHFFQNFSNACKNANAPDAYVAFRQLLIEKPVLTEFELIEKILDSQFQIVKDSLRSAYIKAPIVHAVNGVFYCCPTCDNLLLKTDDDKLVCENELCRTKKKQTPKRSIPKEEGVFWLRREIRRFITKPGIAELRLAKRLRKLGIVVDLWPSFDEYDLRVRFPQGEVWAVDVKDWANPFLLARSVQAIPQDSTWSRAFFVFPDERCRHTTGRTDYVRAFKNHCQMLRTHKTIKATSERNFIKLVKQNVE